MRAFNFGAFGAIVVADSIAMSERRLGGPSESLRQSDVGRKKLHHFRPTLFLGSPICGFAAAESDDHARWMLRFREARIRSRSDQVPSAAKGDVFIAESMARVG